MHWKEIMDFFNEWPVPTGESAPEMIFFPNTCNSYQAKVKNIIAETTNPFACIFAWTIPVYNADAIWAADKFTSELAKALTDDKNLRDVAQNTWNALDDSTDNIGRPTNMVQQEIRKCVCRNPQTFIITEKRPASGKKAVEEVLPCHWPGSQCIKVIANKEFRLSAVAWPGASYDTHTSVGKGKGKRKASNDTLARTAGCVRPRISSPPLDLHVASSDSE